MTYEINRFSTWTLPAFKKDWKQACQSCCWLHTRELYARDAGTVGMYCRNPKAQNGAITACIDARSPDGKCGPDARLRAERIE